MDIPLTLYIHIPWCIKKCPYCDFNSHKKDDNFAESKYVDALISDLTQKLPLIWGRNIKSIFIGGGTPSLFSPEAYADLFAKIRNLLPFAAGDNGIEITLEANPGAIEHGSFVGYKQAGINRVSLGVQSFNDAYLKKLGRIHLAQTAVDAIEKIKAAGFNNFNIDIMYGLPGQSVSEAMNDLTKAISFGSTHLSWYQLTIEPNTVFYRKKPKLPVESKIIEMEQLGRELLSENSFKHYEVSAYSKDNRFCEHNVNYWKFGDYLGIGAGAHSKLTKAAGNDANFESKYIIERFNQYKMPNSYMAQVNKSVSSRVLDKKDMIFEFALNRFRLSDGFLFEDFENMTGLSSDLLNPVLDKARSKGLININNNKVEKTQRGRSFVNDLVELFLI